MRVLAVADADSYLKWGASLLRTAGDHVESDVVLLRNPLTPSASQVRAATGGDLPVVSVTELFGIVADLRPEVVLLACSGPAIRALMDWPLLRGPQRPVLVCGLPGVSYPAHETAVQARAGLDLMVLHSHTEVAAYREVVAELGYGPEMALATLPFLPRTRSARRSGHEVVFAAQSLVPTEVAQRRAVLDALAAVPQEYVPVVKVRAESGERQTHNEALAYADLAPHPRIVFRGGSMVSTLDRAAGFATVSSTAVLEAIALGVPSLVLSDFGVTGELVNLVFADSGLLGTLDDLRACRFAMPDQQWCRRHYFHDPGDNDWLERLSALVELRRDGGLPPVAISPDRAGTRVRRQLRLLLPARALSAASAARRLRGLG